MIKDKKKITRPILFCNHTVPGSCRGHWGWQKSWSIHGRRPEPAPRCGCKTHGRELYHGTKRWPECPLTRRCSASADPPDGHFPLVPNITNSPQTPAWTRETEIDRERERKRSVPCSRDPREEHVQVAINHLSLVNCRRGRITTGEISKTALSMTTQSHEHLCATAVVFCVISMLPLATFMQSKKSAFRVVRPICVFFKLKHCSKFTH